MKTSIFFHETFRISYYHIYLSPPKIWEESEMFGNWTWLPVPPLLVIAVCKAVGVGVLVGAVCNKAVGVGAVGALGAVKLRKPWEV